PHPDHIMCHKISVEAFDAAADPDRYPGAGEPWQPLKLYYDRGFSRHKILAFHEAMLAEGLQSPFADWLKRWDSDDTGSDDKGSDDEEGDGQPQPEPVVTTRI